ncbi:hypothetical protein CAPTEDRAFT_218802 [Capitella teleta]|uniref:Uncharacterized protein n=1 Tax=Capitella teleta TaxID=283909 RepID=R7TWE0_CAPTE|nr:hypothetical protein CAPTEDRAFT_218802 [Capitella teleta]|eukprot:ELT98233.1 hypothetical protein CAPTEDRAFT_218802 [Capitella teleta]
MNHSLIEAVISNDVEHLQTLLQQEKCLLNERDAHGRTPCHLAAAHGQLEALQLLLAAGADVSIADLQGNEPLHCCGHYETIQLMAEHGADLTARNKRGDTPLLLMQRRGVDEAALNMMRQLLEDATDGATDDETVSLIGRRRLGAMRSVWVEFCADLGAERLALVVVVVLLLSLYVAYLATGIGKKLNDRIPIKQEL